MSESKETLPSPQELLEEYLEVMRLQTLSDKYGISIDRIRARMLQTGAAYKNTKKLISKRRKERWEAYQKALKENATVPRPRPLKRQPEQLADEYIELLYLKKVAEKHNISQERVRQVLSLNPQLYIQAQKIVAEKKEQFRYKEFIVVVNDIGYIPSRKQMKDHNHYLSQGHIYYPLRKKAADEGYTPGWKRPEKTEELKASLLSHLKELAAELNHTPCAREIHQKRKYWSAHYILHFGSLRKAQKLAGLKPNKLGRPGRTI
jgi:hypothetical protein